MAKLIQLRRLYWMAVLLLIGYAVIGVRLVETHLVNGEELALTEMVQARAREAVRPERGNIHDANGLTLAENVEVALVWADPTFIDLTEAGLGDFRNQVARLLSKYIGDSPANWTQRLALEVMRDREGNPVFHADDPAKPRYRQYKKLAEKIPMARWDAFKQEMAALEVGLDESKLGSSQKRHLTNLRNSAVQAEHMWMRKYPEGVAAAHILGFVNNDFERTATGTKMGMTGAYGVELAFESILEGSWGYKQFANYPESKNQLALRQENINAIPGNDVHLTIDLNIQQIVEDQVGRLVEVHNPDSVSVIVVRPRTGDILSMANFPTFDPNDRSQTNWENIKNRGITDFIDPGSVFKIVAVAGAMNEGRINLDTPVFCENGRWIYKGIPLKDDQHEFGQLSVKEVIQHSSNIGTAKVALSLGDTKFYNYIKAFGFGQKTGIPLVGESIGMVNAPEKWDGISATRIAIGQSIGVTPLQMVMAYAAIANDGMLMRPRLIDGVEDHRGRYTTFPAQPVRQVVSSDVARKITEALKSVMTDGTGRNAALDGYFVAGKTGTSQQAGWDRAGRWTMDSGLYAATFIGFFPADKPELCISVVVNNPRKGSIYGGSTAAPFWKAIANSTAEYLHIQPDRGLELLSPLATRTAGVGNRSPF